MITKVVRLSRLRETKALVGFTRVDAPEWGDPDSSQRAPLSEGDPTWVPAATTHGEGIFLVLRTDVMSDFERLIAPLRSAPAAANEEPARSARSIP